MMVLGYICWCMGFNLFDNIPLDKSMVRDKKCGVFFSKILS
jgi:hypothetical protein